jgi:hypothetical protein
LLIQNDVKSHVGAYFHMAAIVPNGQQDSTTFGGRDYRLLRGRKDWGGIWVGVPETGGGENGWVSNFFQRSLGVPLYLSDPLEPGKQAAQVVALGVFDLAAKESGGHFVGLVADDEVPIGVLEFGLNVFVAAELVEPGDAERILAEPVAGAGGF